MAEHRGFNLENLNLNKARVNGYKIIEKILNTSCPTGHGLYDSILSPVEVGIDIRLHPNQTVLQVLLRWKQADRQ